MVRWVQASEEAEECQGITRDLMLWDLFWD